VTIETGRIVDLIEVNSADINSNDIHLFLMPMSVNNRLLSSYDTFCVKTEKISATKRQRKTSENHRRKHRQDPASIVLSILSSISIEMRITCFSHAKHFRRRVAN